MRPYVLALLAFGASCSLLGAGPGVAQNPPVPAPTGRVNPPAVIPTPTPPPVVLPLPPQSTVVPAPSSAPNLEGSPAPAESAPVESAPPTAPGSAAPTPTPPPILVEPPQLGVSPGSTVTARIGGVLGAISAKLADPSLAAILTIDQRARTIAIQGVAPGTTTLTVSDERGATRDVPLRVAYLAGAVASDITARITGNPASAQFLRNMAVTAATNAARLRPGAQVAISPDAVQGARELPVDDLLTVSVPLQLNGSDYFSVLGTTRVRFENVALPRIRPQRLLVSDYPERLTENGVLFTADLDRGAAQRFLYYHYNPPGQPARRILLKAQNASNAPALVQFISGDAGPAPNEMEVGHLSTSRFLAREAQNEGSVVFIPPNTTVNLVNQLLPPQNVVSNLLQLREVDGSPLKLTLIAQNTNDPLDQPLTSNDLLEGDVKHARGVYPVPEFFFDYIYNVDGEDLEVPIGMLPLPNLREGQALAGDYGVLQSISVSIVNPTAAQAAIALYENPRGGRATGTFIIDRTLVRSHAVPAFSKYKLREYKVPPHSLFRITIVTMPEGGSSYPVRLILAPDDGSASPGSPNSPVY